jgi:hypothetical protein
MSPWKGPREPRIESLRSGSSSVTSNDSSLRVGSVRICRYREPTATGPALIFRVSLIA